MIKRRLFQKQTSAVVVTSFVEREFEFTFYEDACRTKSMFDGFLDTVEIKAYQLIIRKIERERMTGEILHLEERDLGFICSRSGEVAYTCRILKDLESLDAMEEEILNLMVSYNRAMKKDAFRALKKKIGLRPRTYHDKSAR